jgi:hypothetical protein
MSNDKKVAPGTVSPPGGGFAALLHGLRDRRFNGSAQAGGILVRGLKFMPGQGRMSEAVQGKACAVDAASLLCWQ